MIRHATIEEVRAELENGAVTEATLQDGAGFHLDGFCDFGSKRVYVNPKPAIVETLVHELIHRRWPQWSERRVTREAQRLLSRMTDADVGTWYRRYQQVKRQRKSTKRIEDE